ncbi:hypothetical protein GQ55_1G113900 [Panicum hallii var. hallii]|uniref:Uncharacterized protein n=1 Tax=Panicum hallii var. hallii TaxID=1504633 RepID=A0A2T7F4L5_9POAL|nr:hypothetical protein GQ55_1G113900 [Panicum hallii var. hallii]
MPKLPPSPTPTARPQHLPFCALSAPFLPVPSLPRRIASPPPLAFLSLHPSCVPEARATATTRTPPPPRHSC